MSMILSFHPNIVAHRNILCAGRPPNDEDVAAISQAQAVILPQGCSEALYRMGRKNCPHIFPNYDARFDFPGKIGQTRFFQKMQAPFPPTYAFETAADYDRQFGNRADESLPQKTDSPSASTEEANIVVGQTGQGPFGFPCVFKPDWGGEGEGVFLVKTPQALEKVLKKARRSEQSGQKGFLLQQYIPSRERSLRVAVIGDCFFSYWRIQKDPAEFLTSLKAGAVIDHGTDPFLQEEGKSVVKAFCARTGINLAGFDVIISEDEKKPKPLLLEINYFFGRRGLGGSLRYYELLDQAVRIWLDSLGLSL